MIRRTELGGVEATTVKELIEAGFSKCENCRSNGCIFNKGCSVDEHSREAHSWRCAGICTTTVENYERDVTRYGMGRIK